MPAAEKKWQVNGALLQAYLALLAGLTELERKVLDFLIRQPYQRHPKSDLIFNTWPQEMQREGVFDNSLYQVIFSLCQTIESTPGDPAYLVNWRGRPEGGYQFYPEGRPK